jgi:hypothetical protein
MQIVMIGIAIVATLIILSVRIHNQSDGRRTKHDLQWLAQHGKRVLASVTNVQVEQEWKAEGHDQLNLWNGAYEQIRTFQPCATITTLWTDPQANRNYIFTFKVRSESEAQPFLKGRQVPVLFDPQHPERYIVDAQGESAGLRQA